MSSTSVTPARPHRLRQRFLLRAKQDIRRIRALSYTLGSDLKEVSLQLAKSKQAKSLRIAVDVGGTFTDIVVLDEKSHDLRTHKVLTSSDQPTVAIMAGIASLEGPNNQLDTADRFLHATTLATNAVIERKGARTGLITTRGFRDVLSIQRSKRYDLYNLQMDKPEPLVPRELIEEVTERLLQDGNVLVPLDESDVRRAASALRAKGVDAIAIVFIHGYRNPDHELRAKSIVAEEYPSARCCTSFEVSPVFREYERTSTTVMNAYVMPRMESYLAHLGAALSEAKFAGQFQVMQSNGGLSSEEIIRKLPVRAIESGPAAGAVFASLYAEATGVPNLLSFDMGGTTAKACLIRQFRPSMTQLFEVDRKRMFPGSGLSITTPSVDLVEVGAGGGSIARARLGGIAVGPESSGANPGPACYGLGGVEPTVTDANLVLGYLNPNYFLGGRMRIDPDAAERALRDSLCKELHLDVVEAAWGVHRIVNHNMAQALRLVSIERGYDPRTLPLMCFGGGGPLHGARLAADLSSRKVVIPKLAGVASSVGLLAADTVYESVRTRPVLLDTVNPASVRHIFSDLRREVRSVLHSTVDEAEVTLVASADMRFLGQGYELNLELDTTGWSPSTAAHVRDAFAKHYAAIYGIAPPHEPVEVVQWRLGAVQRGSRLDLFRPPPEPSNNKPWKGQRRAYYPEAGGWITCDVFDRDALRPGDTLDGPAIIEERESTTMVLPGDAQLKVDELGGLVIESPSGGF